MRDRQRPKGCAAGQLLLLSPCSESRVQAGAGGDDQQM